MFKVGDRVFVAFPNKTSIECNLGGKEGKINGFLSNDNMFPKVEFADGTFVTFEATELALLELKKTPLYKALNED